MTYQPVVEGGSCRRVVIVRNRRGVHVGCQDDPIGVRLPEEGVEERARVREAKLADLSRRKTISPVGI